MDNIEKKQIAGERKRILKANAELDKRNSKEKTIKVRFLNVEDPPAPGKPSPPLSFTYERYIFKESRREEDGEDTALRHGNTYILPVSVVNHLNNLRIPVYEQVKDPVTGFPVSRISGYRNRFSCVPVDMEGFSEVSEPEEAINEG